MIPPVAPPADRVTVIGGGLAGCEAAWVLTGRGIPVTLFEMKPLRYSPAHQSPFLAELVCSNSLRSAEHSSAVGLLKEEMRRAGSLVMEAADRTAVPAGKALAVDRVLFSRYIENALAGRSSLRIVREEIRRIPGGGTVVVASGPLTSDALAEDIAALTGKDRLYFYDAISPIVLADSVDRGRVFRASRYGTGEGDYLNCPFSEEEYGRFFDALLAGREVPLREFEEPKYFEGCLPVEIMARRGRDTLRFGPMKPVGLVDPVTGRQPYAVLQLRMENREGTLYNLVGFQTKLARPEQERIFRLVPGLERAEFARFGSIHRNTFIHAPSLLLPALQFRGRPNLFFAGQITGVEGYVESAASGLIAGMSASFFAEGKPFTPPPGTTALGALIRHVTADSPGDFQPMNVNFGLFDPLQGKVPKKLRGTRYADRALKDLADWMVRAGLSSPPGP
jgi:methylenetetrahydrofolate--tRNA-(uracil-5-)-methyltransferase